jgi:Zn-dependent peptidase ImmA (M78 family)
VRTKKDERIREIAALAEELSEYAISPSGIIEPEKLLRDEGVIVVSGDFADCFDGLIEFREKRFYVYCNLRGEMEIFDPRVRFTLAHEAGHYFLDQHRTALARGESLRHASWCDFSSESWVEKEADTFASHLLMPERRFAKAAARTSKGLGGILELADRFGTSVTSTAIRYIDMHFTRAALVRWKPNGDREWSHVPRAAFLESARCVIKSFSDLVPGSATHKLLSGAPTAGKICTTGTLESYWIRGVRESSADVWKEEAVRLGRYGFLTLVYPD